MVAGLIAPVVSMFVGALQFALNSITIDTSEFMYGQVIQDAMVLLLVAAAAVFALRWVKRGGRAS